MKKKGIIDKLIDYSKKIYGILEYSTNYKSSLKKAEKIKPKIFVCGKLQAHGTSGITTLNFIEAYNSPESKAIYILKGNYYVAGTDIGTVTWSTVHTFVPRSRYDDLLTFIDNFRLLFENPINKETKTGPISKLSRILLPDGTVDKASIADKMIAIDYQSKNATLQRKQKENEHLRLSYEDTSKRIASVNPKELIERLNNRVFSNVILDQKFEFCVTDPQTNKKVFIDPRKSIKILEEQPTQAGYTQHAEAMRTTEGDNLFGLFTGGIIIQGEPDEPGKPGRPYQIVPKEEEGRFLNLVCVDDWKRVLEIMGISTRPGPKEKERLMNLLRESKVKIDNLLRNFYIRCGKHDFVQWDADGNMLIGTSLSCWAYQCVIADYLSQILTSYDYDPDVIFGGVNTFEEFLQKNWNILSLFMDSNACFVINPKNDTWNEMLEVEKMTIRKKIREDYNLFLDMMSQTETQEEIMRRIDEQKDNGIDLPVIFDTVFEKIEANIYMRDKKNQENLKKHNARELYNLIKQQQQEQQESPLKISRPISRRNDSASPSGMEGETQEKEEKEEKEEEETRDNFFTQTMSFDTQPQRGNSNSMFDESSSAEASSFYYEPVLFDRDPVSATSGMYEGNSSVPQSLKMTRTQIAAEQEEAEAAIQREAAIEQEREAAIQREAARQEEAARQRESSRQRQEAARQRDARKDYIFSGPNDPPSLAKQYGMPVVKDNTLDKFTSANSEQPKTLDAIKKRIKELEFEKKTPLPPPTSWTDTRGTERKIKELKVNKKNFERLYNVSQKANPLVKSKGGPRTKLPAVINEVVPPIAEVGVPIAEVGPENRKRKAYTTTDVLSKEAKFGTGGRKTKKYKQKRRQTKKKPNKRRTVKRRKPNKRRTIKKH